MNHQELLATIQSLPKDVQFAIANAVLDGLVSEGTPPISEQFKVKFLQREEAFFANRGQGEPWEKVREELFGQ